MMLGRWVLTAAMEPWKAAVRIDDKLAKFSKFILYLGVS